MLALSDFSYKVVLAERSVKADSSDFLLLWTAFPIWQEHQRRKFRKEFERVSKERTG